jgi:formate dehydrogenase subunit delta
MSLTTDEKLVYMANQIARAFAAEGEARAVPKIADHIAKFWDPRMRRKIAGLVAAGGEGLDPLAKAAVTQLSAASRAGI